MLQEQSVSPTYSLRTDTDYARGVESQGLTKPQLRERVLSWFKDEHAVAIYITVDQRVANG